LFVKNGLSVLIVILLSSVGIISVILRTILVNWNYDDPDGRTIYFAAVNLTTLTIPSICFSIFFVSSIFSGFYYANRMNITV
jgi:hypothetical protein